MTRNFWVVSTMGMGVPSTSSSCWRECEHSGATMNLTIKGNISGLEKNKIEGSSILIP